MAIQDIDYEFLKKFKKPIIIHAEHESFNINIADKNNENNLNSINFAKKIADLSNSKKIILHPGCMNNENCSKENAINLIKQVNDKRIIIENVTDDEKNHGLCKDPKEIKEFIKDANSGFCFDINHAIITAINKNEDYFKIIKEFIKLKPDHYHLSGMIFNPQKDHLSFKYSELDIKTILKLLPKDAEITLEVSTNKEDTEYDLNLIKNIIKEI